MRYLLVGGRPFSDLSGTLTFTGIDIIASSDDGEEIKKMVPYQYDVCGGLLLIIDTETGKEAEL